MDEANALRDENRQLREENNRLTDLTRMLLSSQAFSSFLQELSQSGVPPASQQQVAQQPRQERTKSKPTRKDVNPHEASRQLQSSQQQQQQVGMVLMPEATVDMSLFETPAWAPAIPSNDFQVYSVTSLPEAPVLDIEAMSAKTNSTRGMNRSSKSVPILPEIPEAVKEASAAVSDKVELPVLSQAPLAIHSSSLPASELSIMVNIKCDDVPRTGSIEGEERKRGSWESLTAMCDELRETSLRLAALIPSLD
jgi:hypothetical protein